MIQIPLLEWIKSKIGLRGSKKELSSLDIESNIDPVLDFLSTIDLFSKLSRSELLELVHTLTLINLKGGELLLRQNDVGDSLYIVYNGRLRVIAERPNAEEIIGEVGRGGIVGEIALILNVTRTASVWAIRDSLILKLSKSFFDKFVLQNPSAALDIARLCAKRTLEQLKLSKSSNQTSPAVTIAIIPAAINSTFDKFSAEFEKVLEPFGTVLRLNINKVNELHGANTTSIPEESDKNSAIVSWLQEQESNYRYVIYESDNTLSPWTLRCLRQADCILLVGMGSEPPILNQIEEDIFSRTTKIFAKIHLVLLHKTGSLPTETSAWLQPRRLDSHHHLRLGINSDLLALARFVTGNALGLVLCGGGARGLAHIGVLRAIEECKIVCDFVCGTSIGAGYAACHALGMEYQEILQKSKKYIIPALIETDYTFPLLSLYHGKKLSDALIKVFSKELLIENIQKNYFCTATNLSKRRVDIYNRGPLWKAIRTSTSLPGIYPPIINEQNDMIVDGAVLNNMPVDIMRKKINGGKILAIRLTSEEPPQHYKQLGEWYSGWRFLAERLLLKEKGDRVPILSELILRSIMLSSNQYEGEMLRAADYGIEINMGQIGLFDFKSYEKIIQIGYEMALQNFESHPTLPPKNKIK